MVLKKLKSFITPVILNQYLKLKFEIAQKEFEQSIINPELVKSKTNG